MLTTFAGILSSPVDTGHIFHFRVKSIDDAERININLQSDKTMDAVILLHLSIRFEDQCIVQNAKLAGGWCEPEQVCQVAARGMQKITSGKLFTVYILVSDQQFHIAFDGSHVCSFPIKGPLSEIKCVTITKDVHQVMCVDHRQSFPFPFPALQSGDNSYYFSNDVPKPFTPGHVIIITAIPFGNPRGGFIIKFQENGSKRQLLHFNPRFDPYYVVVRNSHATEALDFRQEERSGGFPFIIDQQFKLAIGLAEQEFKFAVNGSVFETYTYKTHRQLELLVLVICAFAANAADFEDGTSICDKCTCMVEKNSATTLSYDFLDCSRSNLVHMLNNWPERFETNNPQREIVFSLSGNDIIQLQQLPPTSAILVFSCRHCKLENLASGLFLDTPNVLRADLSWNKLEGDALSSDIFRGQYNAEENHAILSLDVLDLGNNMITHLNDDTFKYVTNLSHLSLANNAFGQLSDSTAVALKQLIHLKYLDLSYASLTDIDSEVFVDMLDLQELFLQGNKLTVIPDAVFHTTSLVALNIGENPISTLSIDKPLHTLLHLNISSMTMLSSINVDSFQNVKMLRGLTSRNNTELEVFDLTVLRHVANLQELDLSQSNLKHLIPPKDTYDSANNRNELDNYTNNLDVLLLQENPWHCDCDLQYVLKRVGLQLDSEEESRCETPNMLITLHLSDLLYIDVCDVVIHETTKNSVYEKPAFLRPRAIFLTLLSVGIVVGVGIVIGLIIVCLKRRLKDNGVGFASPVRYTSVRESTPSAVYQL